MEGRFENDVLQRILKCPWKRTVETVPLETKGRDYALEKGRALWKGKGAKSRDGALETKGGDSVCTIIRQTYWLSCGENVWRRGL